MQIKQVSTCTNYMPNSRKIKGLSQKIKPLIKLFSGFTTMTDQGLENRYAEVKTGLQIEFDC